MFWVTGAVACQASELNLSFGLPVLLTLSFLVFADSAGQGACGSLAANVGQVLLKVGIVCFGAVWLMCVLIVFRMSFHVWLNVLVMVSAGFGSKCELFGSCFYKPVLWVHWSDNLPSHTQSHSLSLSLPLPLSLSLSLSLPLSLSLFLSPSSSLSLSLSLSSPGSGKTKKGCFLLLIFIWTAIKPKHSKPLAMISFDLAITQPHHCDTMKRWWWLDRLASLPRRRTHHWSKSLTIVSN